MSLSDLQSAQRRRPSIVPGKSRSPLTWPAWVRRADRFVAQHRTNLCLALVLAAFGLWVWEASR